jgi:hypothetical protein
LATLGSVNGFGRGRDYEHRLYARGIAALFLAAFAALVVGCGGSGGTQSTSVARPPGVKFDEGSKIKSGTPRAKMIRELGQPVLTSKPEKTLPGGCVYYPMEGMSLQNVWWFCLDEHNKVNTGATLYSIGLPPPPNDASVGRQVLIGRGDVDCATGGPKKSPPAELASQIKQVTTKSAPKARQGLAALMRKFSKSAEENLAQIKRFNAPPDQLSELHAYEAALGQQIVALDRAATALAAGNAKSYNKQLQRAKDLGDEANAHASKYGFASCAGIKLS